MSGAGKNPEVAVPAENRLASGAISEEDPPGGQPVVILSIPAS